MIKTKESDNMVEYIEVDKMAFAEWLQGALLYQNDDYDRALWYDPIDNKVFGTCEEELSNNHGYFKMILIAYVKGDVNSQYDDICNGCCSNLGKDNNNKIICENWNDYNYKNYKRFIDFQYDCMENVGELDKYMVELDDKYEIVWV